MTSLLKRQVRKFLSKEQQSNDELEQFIDAIDRSYKTSEDQFTMLQRATVISSEELFIANSKLKQESSSQKEVIEKLESVIDKLQSFNLLEERPKENTDSLKLVDFIANQTKEIIEVNQQKDRLLKNLKFQNQELKDYSQMVSHDLKTPLQSIEALTSWIQKDYDTVLDTSGKEKLALIKDNVELMNTLSKGIFEYATIRKIENNFYAIDLETIVDTVLKEITIPKNMNIVIPKKLPTIKGDKYRLKKLFFHILDNAVKYNNKKAMYIEIGFKEQKHFWSFYIKDNGIGIEEKYFYKVFEAFQKLENNNKSTGLGLAVVKKIIDIYNGQIWIESTPDLGTTFCFNLNK
jgi:light-regulated signal transduction histidine kinase (bacteriophytochrome)